MVLESKSPSSPRAALGGGPGAPATTWSGSAGAVALACALARHAKLCAHGTRHLPAFAASRAPPSAAGSSAEPAAGLRTPHFSPAASSFHEWVPWSLRERGAHPTVGSAGAAWQPPARPAEAAPVDGGVPRRHHSDAPIPRFPCPGGRAQHLLLPYNRRGPHSPLSPLGSSSRCRREPADSAFVPWGWQVRLGREPWESLLQSWGSRREAVHCQQLRPQQPWRQQQQRRWQP